MIPECVDGAVGNRSGEAQSITDGDAPYEPDQVRVLIVRVRVQIV